MKKNGFIATSILYSFFLIFITLFVALVMNYLHNQVLISKIDEEAWDFLNNIKTKKVTDLEVGDYVQFRNNSAAIANADATLLNEDANWIVGYISTNGNTKTIYFFSDLDAHETSVRMKLTGDKITKYRPLTIDLYNLARQTEGNLYNNQLLFNKNSSNRINVSMITTSALALARDQKDAKGNPIDDNIMRAIFNAGGDYVVYCDSTIAGTKYSYTAGKYYENRNYNFLLKDGQASAVGNYCGATYDGITVKYDNENKFGYTSVTSTASDDKTYVESCSFASPITYTHNVNDFVVPTTEVKSDLVNSTASIIYTLRMMATATLSTTSNDTYIAGGKGLATDPYIIGDGVQRS